MPIKTTPFVNTFKKKEVCEDGKKIITYNGKTYKQIVRKK